MIIWKIQDVLDNYAGLKRICKRLDKIKDLDKLDIKICDIFHEHDFIVKRKRERLHKELKKYLEKRKEQQL